MRKIVAVSVMLLCAMVTNAQMKQKRIATDNQLKSKLDSLAHTAASIFMADSTRVGLSIGIINNGVHYLYNYGSTIKGKSVLPTGQTVYELASITKTFGSTLLAKAVLDGKVQLNDDIRKYLGQDYPNLAFKGNPITLLHLANLTSALPNWMPDNKNLFTNVSPDSIPYLLDSVHRKYSRQQLYADLHHVKLDTVPGAISRHCNTAAQLLGYILEGVYGKKFEDLLKEQFVVPLKMKNTSLLTKAKIPIAMAVGYDGKGRKMPYINWEDMQVAASIVSSSSDMLQYMTYQLNEKNKAVNLTHLPTFGNLEQGAIGLNWKINKTTKGAIRVSHTGGSLGFSTYMVFYPELNSGVVLLSNEADQGTQGELIKLANNILNL